MGEGYEKACDGGSQTQPAALAPACVPAPTRPTSENQHPSRAEILLQAAGITAAGASRPRALRLR